MHKIKSMNRIFKKVLLIGAPIATAGAGIGIFFVINTNKTQSQQIDKSNNNNNQNVGIDDTKAHISEHSMGQNRNSAGTIVFNDLKISDLLNIYKTIKIVDGNIYVDEEFKTAFFIAVSNSMNLVGGILSFSELSVSGNKYSMMFKYDVPATHESYKRIYTLQIKDRLPTYT